MEGIVHADKYDFLPLSQALLSLAYMALTLRVNLGIIFFKGRATNICFRQSLDYFTTYLGLDHWLTDSIFTPKY